MHRLSCEEVIWEFLKYCHGVPEVDDYTKEFIRSFLDGLAEMTTRYSIHKNPPLNGAVYQFYKEKTPLGTGVFHEQEMKIESLFEEPINIEDVTHWMPLTPMCYEYKSKKLGKK